MGPRPYCVQCHSHGCVHITGTDFDALAGADRSAAEAPPPPPSEGEIGDDWLPKDYQPTFPVNPSQQDRINANDALWLRYLRTERTARRAAERERDEAKRRVGELWMQLQATESRAVSATQRVGEVEKELARYKECEKNRDEIRGMCNGCKGTIYGRDGQITEGGYSWHPVCKVAHRATTAEAKLAEAEKRYDMAGDVWKTSLDAMGFELREARFTLARLRDPDAGMVEALKNTIGVREIVVGAVTIATGKGWSPVEFVARVSEPKRIPKRHAIYALAYVRDDKWVMGFESASRDWVQSMQVSRPGSVIVTVPGEESP